ncbi:MAG TPA: PHP domain-containing protein, partial [Clostridia bacterium]|nr:PHP domain-containing protein [Clostridia bacterium]
MDEIRLFADYHTHTQYRNPRVRVEAHMRVAQRAGLTEVGITDHGPNTIGTRALAATAKMSLGKNGGIRLLEQVRDAVFEIRRRGAAYAGGAQKVTPLAGVEANVIGEDGELDVPSAFLESLDIVLVGLHQWVVPRSIGGSLYFGPLGAALGRTRVFRHKARTIYTKAVVEAVLKNRIDIVTHPGLGFDIDTLELARACAKMGT